MLVVVSMFCCDRKQEKISTLTNVDHDKNNIIATLLQWWWWGSEGAWLVEIKNYKS